MNNAFCPATALHGGVAFPFVIPSVPGFLPRYVGHGRSAPFNKERRMKFADAIKFHRKSGA